MRITKKKIFNKAIAFSLAIMMLLVPMGLGAVALDYAFDDGWFVEDAFVEYVEDFSTDTLDDVFVEEVSNEYLLQVVKEVESETEIVEIVPMATRTNKTDTTFMTHSMTQVAQGHGWTLNPSSAPGGGMPQNATIKNAAGFKIGMFHALSGSVNGPHFHIWSWDPPGVNMHWIIGRW